MDTESALLRYGIPDADTVLIQPENERDLSGMEAEFEAIRRSVPDGFLLIAYPIRDWNCELSPWEAPPVYGRKPFGRGAEETLHGILALTEDRRRTYYLGGYSLAGLFALWAACQTDAFAGVAAASPSLWFPGFTDYLKSHQIRTERVYLSLGDREEHARNPLMATVGSRVRETDALLRERRIDCTLEWNRGGHFEDAGLRTARAFSWLMEP